MVQEREIQPRKIQEADLDSSVRRADSYPVPPRSNNSGTPTTDIASGLALLLSIIAFFLSSYAVIQATSTRRAIETAPPQNQNNGARSSNSSSSITGPISRPMLPFIAQNRFQSVEPGKFMQPTQDQAAEVELRSAKRINSATANLVNVQFQVRRLDRPTNGTGDLDLIKTVALNTRTNERFRAVQTSENQFIQLASLRPNATTTASVTLRVPEDLDRIDLEIPGVRVFRNVPIG